MQCNHVRPRASTSLPAQLKDGAEVTVLSQTFWGTLFLFENW